MAHSDTELSAFLASQYRKDSFDVISFSGRFGGGLS